MKVRSTTILTVRHNSNVAMVGDGQVSIGNTVMKHSANKLRTMYEDKVAAGFAGASADALAMFEKFEKQLEQFNGSISRAAIELAKDWRTDKILRRLEALLIVADKKHSYLISGNGDVIEPDDGVIGIGSGGLYAVAAARAMISKAPKLSAKEIALEAMDIASTICVFTNNNFKVIEI